MRNKTIEAILVAVSVIFTCTVSIFAQAPPASTAPEISKTPAQPNYIADSDIEMLRADLREQRKQITAQNMVLTADEATKFWPIYDQYRHEAIKPNDDRWALIQSYVANYDTMTDAQAQDLIERAAAIDQELLALRMKYVPLFEKVISPKKTALWFQIDRRIDLVMNLQLSARIPLVDVSKRSDVQ